MFIGVRVSYVHAGADEAERRCTSGESEEAIGAESGRAKKEAKA